MKNVWKFNLILAAAIVGLSARAHAQTPQNGVGSSAMFLQLGLAANHLDAPACVWTNASAVSAQDSAVIPTAGDTGNAWVVWKPQTPNVCTGAIASGSTVYSYLQTDSVVGDRCLFNTTCNIVNTNGAEPAIGLLHAADPTVTEVLAGTMLPAAILSLVNGHPNFAGTDIRPEDAKFAISRATTACGVPMTQFTSSAGNTTQYEGLGYTPGVTPNNVITGFAGSKFNVVPFSLPNNGFTVTPLGATPILVVVNGSTTISPTAPGFANAAITNLTRSTLALYLDGSIGSTADALTPGSSATAAATTVWVREPLSGTYNTMEYSIPNSVELRTSQDVGENQFTSSAPAPGGLFNQNCNGVIPQWNTAGVPMGTLSAPISGVTPVRKRAIGTGQELSSVMTTPDSLGYGFWSAANYANYTSALAPNAKYLTVDGVDPLGTGTAGMAGGIPATAAQLANVTLSGVAHGNYPIWSLIRLVNVGNVAPTELAALASTSQQFVTAAHPDFVPYNNSTYGSIPNLAVERAHFTPAGIYSTGSEPVPQNGVCGLAPGVDEIGGDVGGVVISCAVDFDYAVDTGVTYTGTQVPSPSRRQ